MAGRLTDLRFGPQEAAELVPQPRGQLEVDVFSTRREGQRFHKAARSSSGLGLATVGFVISEKVFNVIKWVSDQDPCADGDDG